MKQQMSNMEFGRRLATERDLEKSDVFNLCNIGMYVLQVANLLLCIFMYIFYFNYINRINWFISVLLHALQGY